MSWYGNYNDSTRQLNLLIETKPSFADLLLFPDFIQQLKLFNPKLIDYITNTPSIFQDLISYLSVAPSQLDSFDRKYKFPVLAVEMMETQKNYIMSGLLKLSNKGKSYFLKMYEMLRQPEILPLLAGYFSRCNLQMCKNKYKQTIQEVYSSASYLQLLIEHSQHETIANCLILYLCIVQNRNIFLTEDKTNIKLAIVKGIIKKIQIEKTKIKDKSYRIIENLCEVLREIMERYHFISDKEQMIEIILSEKSVSIILSMIKDESENSFSAMNLTLSFLKYYSLSSLNSNILWLDNQPFIKQINLYFQVLLSKVKRNKPLTLYGYKLLQVLCHCITLPSDKVLLVIKNAQLFPTVLNLLFINECNNIFQKLVERTFLHIFTSDKYIYDKYREYLFCEISIIDLTAKRLLDDFSSFEKARKKGYFGILMKIIKIYCSISASNPTIVKAISAKGEIWNKMVKYIIEPYQLLCKQQIGHLSSIPEIRRSSSEPIPMLSQNFAVIQQIKREQQTMPKAFEHNNEKKKIQTFSQQKMQQSTFFKNLFHENLNNKKSNLHHSSFISVPVSKQVQRKNSSSSFSEFLTKKKAEVSEEMKMQRSHVSASKRSKLPSPPAWMKNSSEEKKNQYKQDDLTKKFYKDSPKISTPSTPSKIFQSNYFAKGIKDKIEYNELKRAMSLKISNIEYLKNTTITRRNDVPLQKRFRNAEEKDKNLFAYLGLRC